MTLIEAAKQALEALEAETNPSWECNSYHPKIYAAITALRTAITVAEKLEPTGKQSLQVEQEPVAWLSVDSIGERYLCFDRPVDSDLVQPLYTTPPAPPVQEPVALEAVYETIIHWDEGGGKRSRRELARRIVALYTTPPAAQPAPVQPVADEDEFSNGLALALHDAVLIRIGKDDEATQQAIARIDKLVAKYTSDATPPAAPRQLVWLSREDEQEIKDNCTTIACVLKAVKAKLKEKNA